MIRAKTTAPLGAESDGLRWCDDLAACGLRFVGFADDLSRAVGHYGWLTDENGDNDANFRGAVYQLPARDGHPVYVAGYREGSMSRQWRIWSDASGEAGARLDLRHLIIGDNADDDAAKITAARAADSIAEHAAERERDYNAAWQAGARWSQLGEDIATARRDALALAREIKQSRPFGQAICAALRNRLAVLRAAIAMARAERDELRDNPWARSQREAFNDGADEQVFS